MSSTAIWSSWFINVWVSHLLLKKCICRLFFLTMIWYISCYLLMACNPWSRISHAVCFLQRGALGWVRFTRLILLTWNCNSLNPTNSWNYQSWKCNSNICLVGVPIPMFGWMKLTRELEFLNPKPTNGSWPNPWIAIHEIQTLQPTPEY